jgi:hypothetical protein
MSSNDSGLVVCEVWATNRKAWIRKSNTLLYDLEAWRSTKKIVWQDSANAAREREVCEKVDHPLPETVRKLREDPNFQKLCESSENTTHEGQ